MSVESLYQTCLYKFGQDLDNVRFQDDFYNALNDGQNEFVFTRNWGFLRKTADLAAADSTRTTSLPDDFGYFYQSRGALRVTSPSASSGNIIQLMKLEEWQNNFYEDGTSEGEPNKAYIIDGSIYWSPIPDTAYTVSSIYYKRATTIADTSTSITIPTVYMEVLKKMIFRRLQDSGYSSVQELDISDTDIDRLIGKASLDDIARYGGFVMNLNDSSFKRRTV